ncbi:IS605 OrfB family transposase [Skermanella aerolata]|uniref:RNA-guided endonuclease InsQ/TnpB family protein n=1 Tax=Skermanella aerolata TaxID=393310 RepID=UPI003D24D254
MQRTICIRLTTLSEQDEILTETLARSQDCFDAVAALGWEHRETNGVALHRATYYELRGQHPNLPSQLVISARMKARDAIRSAAALEKAGRKVSAPQTQRASVRYDARTYRLEPGNGVVGLSTVAGRIKFPFRVHAQARRWLDRATGFDSADLIRRPSGWWLNVVLTIDPPQIAASGRTLGVDLGINRPAALSSGQFLGQRRWKEIEQRYFRLRRSLQSKGSRSAKRHLRTMARRQARFRRDCDHVLSRRIVQSAEPGSVIVLENLTHIRSRTRQKGRRQRRRHHGWSYAQLRTFTTYKAEEVGSRVEAVDPRHTSQRCSRCGSVHRSNRPTRSLFLCLSCGYQVNTDFNAARNIAWKSLADPGIAGFGG